mmetsp:Transcript_17341/g.25699  ORF Transcript_17341/g.25699 Transcript_17341/m.25699 type:complete len:225 (+) Transcript_17341:227-901(+)
MNSEQSARLHPKRPLNNRRLNDKISALVAVDDHFGPRVNVNPQKLRHSSDQISVIHNVKMVWNFRVQKPGKRPISHYWRPVRIQRDFPRQIIVGSYVVGCQTSQSASQRMACYVKRLVIFLKLPGHSCHRLLPHAHVALQKPAVNQRQCLPHEWYGIDKPFNRVTEMPKARDGSFGEEQLLELNASFFFHLVLIFFLDYTETLVVFTHERYHDRFSSFWGKLRQ